VGFFHDALGLGVLDAWELAVKIDGQMVAAGVVFIEVYDCANFGILDLGTELFGGIEESTVKTGGVGGCEEIFRVWAASFDAFLKWISQLGFYEAVSGFD